MLEAPSPNTLGTLRSEGAGASALSASAESERALLDASTGGLGVLQRL